MKELISRIKKMKDTEGFIGYIVITQDSIPISYFNVGDEEAGNKLIRKFLVCYAAVISDLVFKTNLMFKEGEQLRSIRMRTKKGIEIIVTVQNNCTLVVLQDCTKVADVKPRDAKVEGEEK